MVRKAVSLKKKNTKNNSFFLIQFIILISICALLIGCTTDYFAIAGSNYTPQAPIGVSSGDKNEEYEFTIMTQEVGSQWMFDWGDGTYSEYILVEEGDTSIVLSHSWDSYGTYNVRVKKIDIYNEESNWSPSLVVDIAMDSDLDDDGYLNEVEEAYGNDPNDPDDYPLDSDNDGTPDEDSSNGVFVGDLDDDNDGLADVYESLLGSDLKDGSDADLVVINGLNYFIVDMNKDGSYDVLFNSDLGIQTAVGFDGGLWLLNIDSDRVWEYTYKNGDLQVYVAPFEIPWLLIGATIIVIVLIVLFILFKMGVFYVYEEEIVVED